MSAADLEIAVLYETHALLADIISPSLYTVSGAASEQQVIFISEETFALFTIRVGEFVSEPRQPVIVAGRSRKVSLLGGLTVVVPGLAEQSARALQNTVDAFRDWMEAKDACQFWCGEIGAHLSVDLTRRVLWKTHANLRKHTAFRLGSVMHSLQCWTRKSGYALADADVRVALDAFDEWLRGYVEYNATMVAELLGGIFLELNRVVHERWTANGCTSDTGRIVHPIGASAAFAEVHASLMSLKRYPESRITDYTPTTVSSIV